MMKRPQNWNLAPTPSQPMNMKKLHVEPTKKENIVGQTTKSPDLINISMQQP